MIYDSTNKNDIKRAKAKLNQFYINKYKFELKKYTDGRSAQQNRLYWAWLACISDETGDDSNSLHIHFMRLFAPVKIVEALGTVTETFLRTSEMSIKQMHEYMNKIEIFASRELQIILLHPEDLGFEEFYEKYKMF
jgi:hypothetical protein